MAETKTKAEMIREEIARRKAKGEENIRPRDILAALAEKGVKVFAPQVSVALRDFDKPKTEKKKAKAAPVAKAEKPGPKRVLAKVNAHAAPKVKLKTTGGILSPEELGHVGEFVRWYESPAAAMAAVQAYCDYDAALKG